jgi:AraC family transcriptional regulator, arabinose operon regulatory protein
MDESRPHRPPKKLGPHHSFWPDLPRHWVTLPLSSRRMASRHPLMRGLFPSHVGFFPAAKQHQIERTVGLEQAIFQYCVRGRGWCRLGGVTHTVGPGDLLVVPVGMPHAYGADPKNPWTIHWFHAMGEHLPLLLGRLGCDAQKPVVRLGVDVALTALFDEVHAALEDDYSEPQMLLASQILAHLIGLCIKLKRSANAERLDTSKRVALTLEHMKAHLAEDLDVEKLASMAGLSPSRFQALFRAANGISPCHYLKCLRVHRAAQLLDTTNLAIKDIAGEVGYQDALYLSRVFRQVHEQSPSAFRNRPRR